MRTGRPRLKNHQKKSSVTGVRLNSDERRLLERASTKSRKTLSEWMRDVLLENASAQMKSGNNSARVLDITTDINAHKLAESVA